MAFAVCTRCFRPLPSSAVNQPFFVNCAFCRAELKVTALPALHAQTSLGQSAKPLAADDQASCFFHPTKKAVVPCDRCGRFLCDLCDIPTGEHHLCPQCVAAEAATPGAAGSVAGGGTRATRWDNIALWLALAPLAVTIPAAIACLVKHWRQRDYPAPRTATTSVLASAFAAAQTALWIWVFIA